MVPNLTSPSGTAILVDVSLRRAFIVVELLPSARIEADELSITNVTPRNPSTFEVARVSHFAEITAVVSFFLAGLV